MSTTQGKEARHGESATIAQDAAEQQWPWMRPECAQVQKTKAIILAAIDEAKAFYETEILRLNQRIAESRAAQPLTAQFTRRGGSLRQEWTREYVDGLIRAKWSLPLGQVVADAHNATLK
jgi:hypothetical protein